MTFDVIIPALNEASTVGNIVYAFHRHPDVKNIIVMVDDKTTDMTQFVASTAGANVHRRITDLTGKGQLIRYALDHVVESDYVVLSDGDYPRFTLANARLVAPLNPREKVVRIIVPRMPSIPQWKKEGLPMTFDAFAWTWNSGLRSFPYELTNGLDLHGYLTETQLNKASHQEGYYHDLLLDNSLVAPLRFTKERLEKMESDRQWGYANGVFDIPPGPGLGD